MTYIITAKRMTFGEQMSLRSTVEKGQNKIQEGKQIKRHVEGNDKRVVATRDLESVIKKVPGGIKTEYVQGDLYSLHVRFWGDGDDDSVIHSGLSVGEIRKISSFIDVSEGSVDFFTQATNNFNHTGNTTYADPTGTITLAKIKNMAAKSDLFPAIKDMDGKVFDSSDAGLLSYLKSTWLPANTPEGSTVVDADLISIT